MSFAVMSNKYKILVVENDKSINNVLTPLLEVKEYQSIIVKAQTLYIPLPDRI